MSFPHGAMGWFVMCYFGITWSYLLFSIVSGGWTSWSVWSGCSVSCGQGQITRLRSCTNPSPVHGGQNCVGDASQQSNCRLVDCPGNIYQ